jgi:hypothetical protein
VKLFATMTVLSAAVLLIYDAPRLMAVFVTNEPGPPSRSGHWQDRMSTPLRWTIKVLVVGGVLLSSVVAYRGSLDQKDESGFLGLWIVTSFTHETHAPGSPRWSQMIVRGSSVDVRLSPNESMSCKATSSSATAATIVCSGNHLAELRWTTIGSNAQIEGTLDGAHVTASARHVARSEYRLIQSKFRWIMD